MCESTKRRVRRAYRTGALLDLRGAEVGADLLAELLLGGAAGKAGRIARLNLEGARVTGQLDLTSARIETQLRLRRCVFEDTLLLDHADLVSLNLDGSTLPGIEADGIRVAGVFGVRDATITGDVWLLPAHINGSLELDRTTIAGSLYLQRAEIGGAVHLRGTRVAQGVRLTGARVGGDVNLAGAQLTAAPDTGIALNCSGLILDGSLLAHHLSADGSVHIIGAQVRGTVALVGVTLRCPDGYALLMIEAEARLLTLRPTSASAGTISLRDARFGRLVDDPVNWPGACRVELDGLTYERLTRR